MDKETRAHNRVLAEYQRRMQDILDRYSRDMSRLAGAVQADPDRPFAFSDYPPLKDRHAAMLAEMRSLMVSQVEYAVRQEWGRADRKNDALAVSVIGSEEGAAALGYIRRNTAALEAFMTRKTAGMDLSGRVWDITGQFDTQVQDAIDTALLDGKSADELSREVRNLLHNPDALFRRVRDNRGLLHLSKNAKAYHPGQGVYRSAYMNARRMAATEINIAYRTADHLRVQQMDFVVGIEVHLSGNHNCKGVPPGQFVDICDELQGRYPKDFKFTGWHPFCRCYATTVLKTRQEMKEDAARIRNGEKPSDGSVNSVDTLPEGFTKWVDRNQQRIATARTLPYFLRDNGQINADGVWEPFNTATTQTKGTGYKRATYQQLKDAGITIYEDEEVFDEYMGTIDFDFIGLKQIIEDIGAKHGFDKYHFEITPQRKDAFNFRCTGSINGGIAFNLVRHFYRNNSGRVECHHTLFQLEKTLQGKGISKEVFRKLYQEYRRAGVEVLTVEANIDVGGYTWAKYGFYAEDKRAALLAAQYSKHRKLAEDIIEEWYRKNRVPSDEPFPMRILAELPNGKEILKGTDWDGILDFYNKEQVEIWERYLGFRK